MTLTEAHPTIVVSRQLQIGPQRWYPDGEQHRTAGLHASLQSSHSPTAETAHPLADHHHIETIDHRRQHVDPQWITGDEDQPLEGDTHVGGSTDAELGKPGHTDPGSLPRRLGGQCHGQRHCGAAVASDRGTTLQRWQQLDQRLVDRQCSLAGGNGGQRRKPFSQ